jgi:hypothetical protein
MARAGRACGVPTPDEQAAASATVATKDSAAVTTMRGRVRKVMVEP